MSTDTTTRRKPPIKCIPCRVKIGDEIYRIKSDGSVYRFLGFSSGPNPETPNPRDWTQYAGDPEPEYVAKSIRREASRLRRNRNARERHQALRSLGMAKTPYGWE